MVAGNQFVSVFSGFWKYLPCKTENQFLLILARFEFSVPKYQQRTDVRAWESKRRLPEYNYIADTYLNTRSGDRIIGGRVEVHERSQST